MPALPLSARRAVAWAAVVVLLPLLGCGPVPQPAPPPQPQPQPPVEQPKNEKKPEDKPKEKKPEDKPKEKAQDKPKAPIVVSPEQLADDVMKNYFRYSESGAQVKGVVRKRMENNKKEIFGVQFQVPKTDKRDECTLYFMFRPYIPLSDKRAPLLEAGKTVTLRGNVGAAGNGQVTLYECKVVGD